VDGMNSTWWPLDLTNVTLYSSKKNNHVQKYNSHVKKHFFLKGFFALCPPSGNYRLFVIEVGSQIMLLSMRNKKIIY
jgi:hypothetical protein